MADTPCSDSEEESLKKKNLHSKNSESAVVVNQISILGDATVDETTTMPSSQDYYYSVPPAIYVSDISGSFSVIRDTLDLKDTAAAAAAAITKNRHRNKKRGKKDRVLRASVLTEGQRGEEAGVAAQAISSEPRLRECGWTQQLSLATASTALYKKKHIAMERADLISPPYTSDEWEEESAVSDTDGDHTDSSDDDDPKSQVDRLIERGTLMYIEDENSALSSEGESDDDDDDDSAEYDSESDITDVSPLVSATASPLGLSPVLPRRTIPKSPLALHDNRDLLFGYKQQSPFSIQNESDFRLGHQDNNCDNRDSTNMDLLLQAVIELENRNNHLDKNNLNNINTTGLPRRSDPVFIHPIRDNPHHNHLRRNYLRRKNMSFSNEEVRKIDRDNKILLRKIMAAHTRNKTPSLNSHSSTNRSYQNKPTNSSVNRKKGDEKIRRENLFLLKKIQEAKPSKDVDTRIPAGGSYTPHLSSVSNRSLPAPTSSCGAFMRSIAQTPHVTVPPPRKETAL